MNWVYEEKAWADGFQAVCGIDEAGRGPFAGPVCAAAVILPAHLEIRGLNDSKKVSEKKRELLFDIIREQAVAWSVSFVDEKMIDQINILQATYRAMERAFQTLPRPADFAFIDGNQVPPKMPVICRAVVAGDAKIPSVAAASIIAKVTRDRLMRDYDKLYPAYDFIHNKGYGTKSHQEALLLHGPCPIHRKTFLRKFYQKHPEAPRWFVRTEQEGKPV